MDYKRALTIALLTVGVIAATRRFEPTSGLVITGPVAPEKSFFSFLPFVN